MTDDESITVNLTVTATPAAPRVPLTISKDVTQSSLRQQVSETTKIPLGKLRLIYAGKLIKDDDTNPAVAEFKLEEGSVLHCMGQPESSAAASSQPVPSVSAGSSVTMPSTAGTARAAVASVPRTADPLQTAFATLRSSNPPAVYQAAVTTLDKILSNIVENPMEEKYRRVKRNNAAFQRRLGALSGGNAAMHAAGFTEEVHEGEEVYMMEASAEKWPQLMAAKASVEAAVRDAANHEAQQPILPNLMGGNLPAAAGMPGFGNLPGMNPADMNNAMNHIMSDPNALQGMLQNPMVQNMMRNDPRFANNPMMQQGIEQLANNPAMLQQLTQMMRDPDIQQQMQSMMNNRGAGMMNPGMFGMPNNAGGAANNSNHAGASTGANNNADDDQQQTEEEMIAEAIRRSLEDGA